MFLAAAPSLPPLCSRTALVNITITLYCEGPSAPECLHTTTTALCSPLLHIRLVKGITVNLISGIYII